jgi:hypothetical protein
MKNKRSYFTADGYRRLARNPFVDKEMLQFIRRKTPADMPVAPSTGPNPGKTKGSHVPVRQPVLSEDAARLIAAALKGLLNG